MGGLRLHAIATPGHTDEHLALLLLDGDLPVGVFTGGSLLVGSAARTDLVDPDRTEELARAQYASLQRLLCLPDPTIVWPTHGAGSFCSAPPGADRISTIGRERATNALLQAGNQDAFVARLLAGLGSFPPYFLRLRAEVNRRGPGLLADVTVPALDVDAVRALRADGAEVIDVRPDPRLRGRAHPRVADRSRCAPRSPPGWAGSPRTTGRSSSSASGTRTPTRSSGRRRRSATTPWPAKWAAASTRGRRRGGPVTTSRLVAPDQIGDARVLDIRQRAEFATGHVPGARNIELGALPGKRRRGAEGAHRGHVRARGTRRRSGRACWSARATATWPSCSAAPTMWSPRPAGACGQDRDATRDPRHGQSRRPARPARQPRPVRRARRGQRTGRRDARPGTHGAAAACRAGLSRPRLHLGAGLHRGVRRGEGRHQLRRRAPCPTGTAASPCSWPAG